MKRRSLSLHIGCLGLILFVGFLSAAASPGPGPVTNLKEAKALMARYEKELTRAKASRGHLLAELARLCFIMGEFGKNGDGKKYFEKGLGYAELLRREQPRRAEGHYWLALNLGGLAGISGDLVMVPAIVKEMKVAASLDAHYNQAGPDRVLGRIYYEAPPWPLSVGDLQKSLRHLRAAVKLAPSNSTNHLFLAETLIKLQKSGQACRQLKQVLAATTHANWAPGLQADHRKALQLLKTCKTKPSPHAI
jgi:tetratricopeptide (TPR) repeat protein